MSTHHQYYVSHGDHGDHPIDGVGHHFDRFGRRTDQLPDCLESEYVNQKNDQKEDENPKGHKAFNSVSPITENRARCYIDSLSFLQF